MDSKGPREKGEKNRLDHFRSRHNSFSRELIGKNYRAGGGAHCAGKEREALERDSDVSSETILISRENATTQRFFNETSVKNRRCHPSFFPFVLLLSEGSLPKFKIRGVMTVILTLVGPYENIFHWCVCFSVQIIFLLRFSIFKIIRIMVLNISCIFLISI